MKKSNFLFLVVFLLSQTLMYPASISELVKLVSNTTHKIQYFFFTKDDKVFLMKQRSDKTYSLWHYTQNRKWQPIHNARASDGFALAVDNIEIIDRNKAEKTVSFGKIVNSDISEDVLSFLKILENKTIKINWYFLKADNYYFLLKELKDDDFRIWHYTQNRKWQPIHNAGKFDGFKAATKTIKTIKFNTSSYTLELGGSILSKDSAPKIPKPNIKPTSKPISKPVQTQISNTNPSELIAGEEYEKQILFSNNTTYSLLSSPEGMSITQRTGKIYWTPTPNQVGKHEIQVLKKSSGNTKVEVFTLTVKPSSNFPDLSYAIFFSPNAQDGGRNNIGTTYDKPNLTSRWFCLQQANYPNITTFYYRGGVYHNLNFGNSLENTSSIKIDCSGTKNKPLTIKPWGNEKVKIKFDGNYGLQLDGDYLHLENFEIEGMSQEITYKDAIAHWWTNEKFYNSAGLQYTGTGIVVRNNIIHDVPGGGMNNQGKQVLDDLLIEGNIIFNVSWWNTGGTTAIGIVGADEDTSVLQSSSGANIHIKNNLVFANESRIFSHVFSKGFSSLTIDEGSSTLLKQEKGTMGTYDKGFLLEGNFYLFNGKGVSLRWNKITFNKNTFYNNATTISGKAGALRSNGGTNLSFTRNAIFSGVKDTNVIDFSTKVTLKECSNNLFWKNFSNAQDCETEQSNIVKEDMFADPVNNNFQTSGDYGASTAIFDAHKKKLYELGYEIKPANFRLEINGVKHPVNSEEYYEKQISDIVSSIPDGGTYKLIDKDGDGKVNDYEITFPSTNNLTKKKVFYLKVE